MTFHIGESDKLRPSLCQIAWTALSFVEPAPSVALVGHPGAQQKGQAARTREKGTFFFFRVSATLSFLLTMANHRA